MNKKGFAFIELLAIILAIIVLIATPIILNIINNIKGKLTLRKEDFYLDAVELSITQSNLQDNKSSNGNYIVLESVNLCYKNEFKSETKEYHENY